MSATQPALEAPVKPTPAATRKANFERWRMRPRRDERVNPFQELPRVEPSSIGYAALAMRAMDWLAPYSRRTYPGQHRTILSLLDFRVTFGAVRHWSHGRRSLPSWAARAWADAIESRSRRGLQLVDELRAHADKMDARPAPRHGFCAPGANWNFGRGAKQQDRPAPK